LISTPLFAGSPAAAAVPLGAVLPTIFTTPNITLPITPIPAMLAAIPISV
jgi:hypothetical protein